MQDCLCENHSQSLWGESLVEVIKGKSCVFDMLHRKKNSTRCDSEHGFEDIGAF